jgi:ATP citrate (pro-S)-lyase
VLDVAAVCATRKIFPLDMAAKIDEAADFLCQKKWGELEFPAPFGRPPYPEEAYIKELDSKTGASLKLTILNRKGRVWTMIAGGGASVAYADTISDLGFGHELANYGEYSGAPSRDMTYEYAKTIIQLMGQVCPCCSWANVCERWCVTAGQCNRTSSRSRRC